MLVHSILEYSARMPERTVGRHCFLPLRSVTLRDGFWGRRLGSIRHRTLPVILRQLRETGRLNHFRADWRPEGELSTREFVQAYGWQSDVAKWVEAASYALVVSPDSTLESQLDEVIELIVGAQQSDGYLNPCVQAGDRWANLRDLHELYTAGHTIEAAVAHYEATGKRRLLEAAIRLADHIHTVFGTGVGQRRGYCGHPEIELALIRLARATADSKYLRLSEYFVRERGRQPHYFDLEATARGELPGDFWAKTYEYCQAHRPVLEQTEVVGHAVRAVYLYCAMADLAVELDDAELLESCRRLWTDLCTKKLYVTGGIGSSVRNEGFTQPYDLPSRTAYAETCAAVALVLWSKRLLQAECDRRYADVMELALYNGVLGGVSLDGDRFFYVNPLESDGTHLRQDWFECACCPPNIARLLGSVAGLIYARRNDGIAVHLYAASEALAHAPDGTALRIRQETEYPWQGEVRLAVDPEVPVRFSLRLRLPAWCRSYELRVNDTPVRPTVECGYAVLCRQWCPGDSVRLSLAMPVERVVAHPEVEDDRGRIAIMRGPLVYCLEEVDHAVDVRRISLPDGTELCARFEPETLGGVVVIEGDACAPDSAFWRDRLYAPADQDRGDTTPLRAVPYYAWGNRRPGRMTAWLSRRTGERRASGGE